MNKVIKNRHYFITGFFCLSALFLVYAIAVRVKPVETTKADEIASLTITLPPKIFINPNQLKLTDVTTPITISCPSNVGDTNKSTATGTGSYTVTTILRHIDSDPIHTPGNPDYRDVCEIKIDNFVRLTYSDYSQPKNLAKIFVSDAKAMAPPPASNPYLLKLMLNPTRRYEFELTFQTNTLNDLPGLTADLAANGPVGDYLQIAGTDVQFKTELVLVDPGKTSKTWLTQTVPLKKIMVEGNVGSNSALSNFVNILPGAIIVSGSTILNVTGNSLKNIQNYTGVTNIIASAKSEVASARNYTTIDAFPSSTSLFLNSSTTLDSNSSNSFSTPPEGKLWKYNNNLTITSATTFTGRGTIIVDGNLNINNNIICSPNTQVGFIVYGNITFDNQTASPSVDCGAFLSLVEGLTPGNINLTSQRKLNISSILIAEGSIQFPNAANLNGPIVVSYDKAFANNPTILFKKILGTISPQGY